MSELAVVGNVVPLPANLDLILSIEDDIKQCEQIEFQTEHVLHGGMYARTVRLFKGAAIAGCRYRVPTVVIINGHVGMLADKWYDLQGYQVMPALAGRKQIFVAIEPTEITMIFATKAKTVEEAENEMTEEAAQLISRKSENDITIVTGVPCQE